MQDAVFLEHFVRSDHAAGGLATLAYQRGLCSHEQIMTTPRIYLDNAATSWPKPEGVYAAADSYQRQIGAPGGRGGYRSAAEADRIIARARQGVARLLGIENSRQVIFTSSGTDALHLAIDGLLRPGDHVVTTVCEHNSVLRPLRRWIDEQDITVTYLPCDAAGYVSPDDVQQALHPNTRLVAVTHASNVTGAIQPVEAIGQIVRDSDAFFLIDAAQTLGEEPFDAASCHADLVAAPAHKGLLAPLGLGILCVGSEIASHLRPVRTGGTGTSSEAETQPGELPHKYEVGNLNLPGIAGLAAAMEFLSERGIETIAEHHRQLTSQLLEGLSGNEGVTIHGPGVGQPRTSVVSFSAEVYDPHELASVLEMSAGVECRAGLHCAPRMHAALGTLNSGGTVRLSPGWATTTNDIEITLRAIAETVSLGVG